MAEEEYEYEEPMIDISIEDLDVDGLQALCAAHLM